MNVRQVVREIRENNRSILVVGLGISGIETVKFLGRIGVKSLAVEREEKETFLAKSRYAEDAKALMDQGAELHFGIDGEMVQGFLNDVALCVLSPGVSLESAIVGAIKRHSIPVICELEFGIELLGTPCIVVTGSNGKSTTVSLLHDMLSRSGFSSTLCGNVGTPVVAGVPADVFESNPAPEKNVLVVEASSYQLESCSVLAPKIGMLLNLSENHLERHGTMERYLSVKSRVFQSQTENDFVILGFDDPMVKGVASKVKGKICGFGSGGIQDLKNYSSFHFDPKAGIDEISLYLESGLEKFDVKAARLRGRHNRLNIAAAALAARLFGASKEAIEESIRNFTSLEHRLEHCLTVRGVTFINDSKSTTVAATKAALQAVLDESLKGKLSLMIGGLSKAGSWQPVMSFLEANKAVLHPVICFGKDRRLLGQNCAQSKIPYAEAENLQDGVQKAFEQSGSGDIVLLSPGCASFDQFTDFENRGSVFKSVVAALQSDKAA